MCRKICLQKVVVTELIAWIEDNIESPIHVADIALRSGYSHWHIQRLFKKFTSKSLGTYIRERKLFLAAKALAGSEETILSIAVRYGFDSQQVFTRQFTRHFHMAPGQWRREGGDYWPSCMKTYSIPIFQ